MRKFLVCLCFAGIIAAIAILKEPGAVILIVAVLSVLLFVNASPGHYETNQMVYGIGKYRFPVWTVGATTLCLAALNIGLSIRGQTRAAYATGAAALCALLFLALKRRMVLLRPLRFWKPFPKED